MMTHASTAAQPGVIRDPGWHAALPAATRDDFTAFIDDGNVDVWRIDLDRATPAAWAGVLSPEEFARAARLRRPQDRNRFLQCRFSLRQLLGRYLNQPAEDVLIRIDANGKPHVAAADALQFNLSHCGALAAIALGRQPAIGIDIEQAVPQRDLGDLHGLAQQVMSPDELAAFARLDDAALLLPFLTAWTRKEAFLKALGIGLYRDPRTVEGGLLTDPLQLDESTDQPIVVSTLLCGPDCVLSLAVSSPTACGGARTRIRQFSDAMEAA